MGGPQPEQNELPRAGQPARQTASPANAAAPAAAEAPLPYDVDAWLRTLDAAQQEESEDYPPTVRKRLLYVPDRGPHSGGLIVSTQSIELKRDGTMARTSTRHQPDQLLRAGQQPKFLRPSDRSILRQLLSARCRSQRGIHCDAAGHHRHRPGAAGQAGMAQPWPKDPPTPGRPQLADLRGWQSAARVGSPCAVDRATARKSPGMSTRQPGSWARSNSIYRHVLSMPCWRPQPYHRQSPGRVREEMTRRLATAGVYQPRRPWHRHEGCGKGSSRICCFLPGELPFDPTRHHPSGPGIGSAQPTGSHRVVALARLSWRYGPISPARGNSVPAGARGCNRAGCDVRAWSAIMRAEEQATETAPAGLGLVRISHHQLPAGHPSPRPRPGDDRPGPGSLARVRARRRPSPCGRMGWLVDIADDFPLRLVEPSGDLSFELTERSGIDWFDLDLGVMLDGQRISPGSGTARLHREHRGWTPWRDLGVETDDHALPMLLPLPGWPAADDTVGPSCVRSWRRCWNCSPGAEIDGRGRHAPSLTS